MATYNGSMVGLDRFNRPDGMKNIFGILPQYDGKKEFFNPDDGTILPTWTGYVVVVGFSIFFASISIFLVMVEEKFAGVENNSEQFSTAGRSLGAGLIAVDVVSKWTWAGWIITASTWTLLYGASAIMWVNIGGTVCVWVFAILSIELKIRAPKAHTVLEIIRVRWGREAHLTYFCFVGLTIWCATVNMTYSVLLITEQLTGANVYVMAYLIPAGVVAYASVGGLKATFTTAYVHTIIIYIVLCIIMFKVFASNGLLGNIDLVYDRLVKFAEVYPCSGNRHGSYLTSYTSGGFQLGIVFTFGCFAFLFIDQSYWQSAIAAKPTAAINGYILGAILIFPIGYVMNMVGLAPLALDLPLSEDEVYNGAGTAALYYMMLGKTGPVLVVILCYMAVTSSGAGEMLAISSLFTFDVWREYIHPKAGTKELVFVARTAVIMWGLIMGTSLSVLHAGNVNLVLINLAPSVLLCCAIPGIACALMWDRGTKLAGISSALLGLLTGIISWTLFTKYYYGTVNVNLLSANYPILVGTCVNLAVGCICMYVFSVGPFSQPKFNWEVFNEQITMADDNATGIAASGPQSIAALKKARKVVYLGALGFTLLLMIIWPTVSLWQPVWSRGNFGFWMIFGIVSMLLCTATAILYPLWEARVRIRTLAIAFLTRKIPALPSDMTGGDLPNPKEMEMTEPSASGEDEVKSMEDLMAKVMGAK